MADKSYDVNVAHHSTETDIKTTNWRDLLDNMFPEVDFKSILGIIIVYLFIVLFGTYFTFHYLKFSDFILYISNVDLIANTLATAYPDIFKLAYNPSPNSFITYLSYNSISLVALSGIFMAGLQMKLIGRSDWVAFESMVVVAIVTYTLPTTLIPLLTKITDSFIINDIVHKRFSKDTESIIKMILSIIVAIGFIMTESFILHNYIYTKDLESDGKRLFGKRFKLRFI